MRKKIKSLTIITLMTAQICVAQPEWGVSAINIGVASKGAVMFEKMMNDKNILSLNRFYRIGGEDVPSTPTECKMMHAADTFYVMFRCRENNMNFPAIDHEDWYSLLGSSVEQDASFPDKVDLYLFPSPETSMSYYLFSVLPDGRMFASKFNDRQVLQDADGTVPQRRHENVTGFAANVVKKENEWVVLMRIPWEIVGGKPQAHFGLTPFRTRWRNSEVSSPVAESFHDRRPANDIFIEARLENTPNVFVYNQTLCRLPSGKMRWQRPARVLYPDMKTKTDIRNLQESLHQTTTEKNLSERLTLIQKWVDLMELEGCNFGSTRGSLPDEDLYLSILRTNINGALAKNDLPQACKLTDEYLAKIDPICRRWYADGSPGNILSQTWTPISELTGVEAGKQKIVLHCKAGNRPVRLYLSVTESGGVRLHADKEGFFKPDGLRNLHFDGDDQSRKYIISDHEQKIVIHKNPTTQNPFVISLLDASENLKFRLDGGRIAFLFDAHGNISAVDVRTDVEKNEVIFGFGEKFDRFNQNDNVLTLWGMDDWIGLTTGLQNQSYKPIPVYHSSKGYMVFINSSYRLRADVGKSVPGVMRLTQHGDLFDYYFWICEPEKALQSYADLTGKPVLPPRWVFEPWMGRTGRGWRATALSPVDEKIRVIRRFEELDIPHSAIYAEGVGAERPELHAFAAPRNIKVMSWYYSAIPLNQQRRLMPELDPESLPFLRVNNPNNLASRDISYVDFTHPQALELSRRWWKLRLDLGVAGSMVDFGDRVPEDVSFYNGMKGAEMHNFYAYDYHRTYAEVFRERRGDDFILFGRSVAPGTQKWVAQFSGDLRSNLRGLQGGVYGMLSLCAGGFSTWGSDLGGFRAWAEPAVYMRWTQFACFSPLMRCHGRTPREPWEYGEPAVSNYKYYAWVRKNLTDYIYQSAIEAHQTGLPMVRAMALAFPEQPAVAVVDDQYMFGKNLLVCPVITDENSRTVTLPSGKWTDMWTGDVVTGPFQFRKETPLETIPVYLREGAVIPLRLNQNLRFGESMTNNMVQALMISLPEKEQEIEWVCGQNAQASVKIIRKVDSFDISLQNMPEILYLIVYDQNINEVKIDGKPLPQLKEKELETLPPGWFHDMEVKRTVIRLPHGLSKNVEIVI